MSDIVKSDSKPLSKDIKVKLDIPHFQFLITEATATRLKTGDPVRLMRQMTKGELEEQNNQNKRKGAPGKDGEEEEEGKGISLKYLRR